ncbi:HAD hydrolase family protein [Candidatus Saccharibacteria bacterium]|nr:MAG: HAD hydrolase family protein [Candidatus Saccharibacteria bacterium]
MMSIDVLSASAPQNYLALMGAKRDALKIKDPEILQALEQELTAFVNEHVPGWSIVNLGNANFEITPKAIEKDAAIRATSWYRDVSGVLVLGDSANDKAMFTMKNDAEVSVTAGLVLHREASLSLVDGVDCVSFGMANAYPHLRLLYAQRKHLLRN